MLCFSTFMVNAKPQTAVEISQTQTININTADAQTLANQLKGIGIKKAEAIVAYRNKNGDFQFVDDLALVKGIGDKTVEKNRENIVLK